MLFTSFYILFYYVVPMMLCITLTG